MYYLQIKSSPNSMNVDTILHLNRKVKELQEHRENYKTVLGLTFGTQAQVSAQITHYIDESVTCILTGKELWEFVSEEANFHSRVLDIISEIVEDGPPKTFSQLIDDKCQELRTEWVNTYGAGTESINNLIADWF